MTLIDFIKVDKIEILDFVGDRNTDRKILRNL